MQQLAVHDLPALIARTDDAPLVLDVLPTLVVIRPDDPRGKLFAQLRDLLVAEVETTAAGGALVLDRLAQVLFVHMLRAHAERPEGPTGWLGALRDDLDPKAARAMAVLDPVKLVIENYAEVMGADDVLDEYVLDYHRKGYQMAFHAIGDAAIEQVLRAYEKALAVVPDADRRHRIEHCGFLTDDHMARMKAAGVYPAPQPVFIYDFGDLYYSVLGSGRPEASVRPAMTAMRSTQGASSRSRLPSMSYSRRAISSVVSLIATTRPERFANRTRWRDRPFGSHTMSLLGRSARPESMALALPCSTLFLEASTWVSRAPASLSSKVPTPV